jgi:hypothetical protein
MRTWKLLTPLLALGLAWGQALPKLGFLEAARAAEAHLRSPTPPEEISLSWREGRPVYGVDLARGAYLVQVYVDGESGKVLGQKPLKERALGARAWLRTPPGIPLKEAVARAQKALGTGEAPAEVAYQVWRGRPVLRVDIGARQAILDAKTGALLGTGPAGK